MSAVKIACAALSNKGKKSGRKTISQTSRQVLNKVQTGHPNLVEKSVTQFKA